MRTIEAKLDDCLDAFKTIVDMLDGEYDPEAPEGTHDRMLAVVAKISHKLYCELRQSQLEREWCARVSASYTGLGDSPQNDEAKS